jgi:hypothetical protein
MSRPIDPALTAPHKLSYTYKRSLGPVLGKFFTALRDRQILGARRKVYESLCGARTAAC